MSERSRFLDDILREPGELRAILARTLASQRGELEAAASLLRRAPQPLLVGMGSSHHGGLAIQSFFDAAARPVRNVDAGELVHSMALAPGPTPPAPPATLLVLSRSGRSIEVVQAVAKARAAGATVIGVTNDPESPLAKGSRPTLLLGAPFDFNVSVTMYSGIALVGALAAAMAVGAFGESLVGELDRALVEAERRLAGWRAAIAASDWFAPDASTYLLARGAGLAAALEARQLWEEACKLPATALGTAAFRHGPNEVVRPGLRVVLWIAPDGPTRGHDLALAADLRNAGAKVLLVGQGLRAESSAAAAGRAAPADLLLELPPLPPAWQFLVELIPVQLAAEHLAHRRGVDCDRFDHCPFVVASEGGLGEGHGA